MGGKSVRRAGVRGFSPLPAMWWVLGAIVAGTAALASKAAGQGIYGVTAAYTLVFAALVAFSIVPRRAPPPTPSHAVGWRHGYAWAVWVSTVSVAVTLAALAFS